MKPFVLISLTVLALVLAACGGATAPAVPVAAPIVSNNEVTAPLSATYLKIDYADATSLRNQLALGTLKLEGTANAITAEQAKALLPLWQAVVALSGTTTTAEAELTAVQNQIAEALQPAQSASHRRAATHHDAAQRLLRGERHRHAHAHAGCDESAGQWQRCFIGR